MSRVLKVTVVSSATVVALAACTLGGSGPAGVSATPTGVARTTVAPPPPRASTAVLTTGEAGPPAPSRSGTGLAGVIVVVGGCGVGSACPDRPIAAYLAVLSTGVESGQVLARFNSGSDGRFGVGLRPDEYTIRVVAVSGVALHEQPEINVRVWPDEYTSITLRLDASVR
jgi:hypothetical protein